MSHTLTCGAMVATITRLGVTTLVHITGPGVDWQRYVPDVWAAPYAASQIGFPLTTDSAHTAGLAFNRKVKTPGHHAVKRVLARKGGRA